MPALQALYLQDPYWLWLAGGALLISLNLATGHGLLMWPAAAAVVVAVVEAAGLRLGPVLEICLFVVLCLGAGAFLYLRTPRARATPIVKAASTRPSGPPVTGRQDQTARLVGRIGRSTGEFVNGVGRVWIDGAEWGAELDGAEVLPEGEPVRVTRVLGGIRLQVHALN